jgi:exonuclease III
VRGLNNPVRRKVVRDLVGDTRATIVTLQETKLDLIDRDAVIQTLGDRFASNFGFLPAVNTRGGILIAVDDSHFRIQHSERGLHSVTAKLSDASEMVEWFLTAVYGPQGDHDKLLFLGKLSWMQQIVSDKWLMIGDFNLILQANDKSNNNLNRRLMGAFRDVIQDLELKELNLRGRKFTWSNDRTQTRIDQAFCSAAWDLMFPGVSLQALSSKTSDHYPLLITGSDMVKKYQGFRFEALWPLLSGFQETVVAAWAKNLTVTNPILRLHIKLQRTSAALRRWAKSFLGPNKITMKVVSCFIGVLDVVQDYRQLSEQEIRLKRDLKARLLGLTAVERLRARQSSRLLSIKAAEANTKLFYIQANGCRRKNYIHSLNTVDGVVFSHGEKASKLYEHYSNHFGRPQPREHTLNWHALGLPSFDLSRLQEDFTEEDLLTVIQEIAAEKAPGPDGFIGTFFKKCWNLIKQDVWHALVYFSQLHGQHHGRLNSAHMVLLPKKTDAKEIGDFRPISLIHSVAKKFQSC